MPGIPSKDASFVWGTPRNYALTIIGVDTATNLLLKTLKAMRKERYIAK